MNKVLAILLSVCMMAIVFVQPVLAAETSNENVTILEKNTENSCGELIATFNVDEDGKVTISPKNTDLATMSQTYNLVKFYAKKGTNIKIHINVTSITGSIKVHFHVGNAYATSSDPIKATWTGTGHKYADLKLNASAGYYSVYLRGAFVGSGAVYSEP